MTQGSKAAVILVIPLSLSACATVHGSGRYGLPVDDAVSSKTFEQKVNTRRPQPSRSQIVVSASEDRELATQYFGVIDLTFENKSSTWKRVASVDIDFGSDDLNDNVEIPLGSDLLDWANGATRVAAMRRYNLEMAGLVVSGVAYGVAASTTSPEVRRAAAAVALSGATVLTARTIDTQLDELHRAGLVPQEHLLSETFTIPPGLFTKRWITLRTKRNRDMPYVRSMVITLNYETGPSEAFLLRFREFDRPSSWQAGHPEVASYRNAKRMLVY